MSIRSGQVLTESPQRIFKSSSYTGSPSKAGGKENLVNFNQSTLPLGSCKNDILAPSSPRESGNKRSSSPTSPQQLMMSSINEPIYKKAKHTHSSSYDAIASAYNDDDDDDDSIISAINSFFADDGITTTESSEESSDKEDSTTKTKIKIKSGESTYKNSNQYKVTQQNEIQKSLRGSKLIKMLRDSKSKINTVVASPTEEIMSYIMKKREMFNDVCSKQDEDERYFYQVAHATIASNYTSESLDQIKGDLDENYQFALTLQSSPLRLGQCGSDSRVRHLQVRHLMQVSPILAFSAYSLGFSAEENLSYDDSFFELSNETNPYNALVYVKDDYVLGLINYCLSQDSDSYDFTHGHIDRLVSFKKSEFIRRLTANNSLDCSVGSSLLSAACTDIFTQSDCVILDSLHSAVTFYEYNGFTQIKGTYTHQTKSMIKHNVEESSNSESESESESESDFVSESESESEC